MLSVFFTSVSPVLLLLPLKFILVKYVLIAQHILTVLDINSSAILSDSIGIQFEIRRDSI